MTKKIAGEMRDGDEILLEIKELKKQMNDIATKIDCVVNNQAIIIGVLNGTIEISPFYQQDAEKMH